MLTLRRCCRGCRNNGFRRRDVNAADVTTLAVDGDTVPGSVLAGDSDRSSVTQSCQNAVGSGRATAYTNIAALDVTGPALRLCRSTDFCLGAVAQISGCHITGLSIGGGHISPAVADAVQCDLCAVIADAEDTGRGGRTGAEANTASLDVTDLGTVGSGHCSTGYRRTASGGSCAASGRAVAHIRSAHITGLPVYANFVPSAVDADHFYRSAGLCGGYDGAGSVCRGTDVDIRTGDVGSSEIAVCGIGVGEIIIGDVTFLTVQYHFVKIITVSLNDNNISGIGCCNDAAGSGGAGTNVHRTSGNRCNTIACSICRRNRCYCQYGRNQTGSDSFLVHWLTSPFLFIFLCSHLEARARSSQIDAMSIAS